MLEIITQTNRAMLFDVVNPEKLDLLTLVGDTKAMDSLSDEKIKEIDEELLVHSFSEYLERFDPKIYYIFDANRNRVLYTLEKPQGIPEDLISEIALTEYNDLLNMLLTLIKTKRVQGIANVDFKFEKILDLISPRKKVEDIKQARKEIRYNFEKHEALEDGDPQKLDLGDTLNVLLESASKNYNNIMAMLPLAIEDIKTRLLLGQGLTGDTDQPLRIGQLTIGDEGELRIIEAPKESTELALIDNSINESLMSVFAEDYQALNDQPSDYVQSLVVRTFCPLTGTFQSDIDVQKEIDNYNTYLEFYKTAQNDFIKAVKPLIQKVLGVYMFFDQYQVKNKGMAPTLLVTNCKLEMMTKASYLPRLETYLNTVNSKNHFDHTIWFGIVPDIEIEPAKRAKLSRERFKGNVEVQLDDVNTMENLAMLLNVARDYRVQIFFGFETGERTTFNHVATNGVEVFFDRCAPLMRKDYSEYAVPCLPNFTIIPKDKSAVVLDHKMLLSDGGVAYLSKEKEDIFKMWIEGIYVSAAYVAAGIIAATQCPEYLRERFRMTTRDFPGVRFDIEKGDYALHAVTTMAKEISGYTNNIKDAINRSNFGFIFASETIQTHTSKGNLPMTRITVYKARSMENIENDFQSVYKTLYTSYIERMVRFVTNDFKQDNLVFFFSNNPRSQKSRWLLKREYTNSILQEGDDITYQIDELTNHCIIHITFNGSVKNLEVEIQRSTLGAAAV